MLDFLKGKKNKPIEIHCYTYDIAAYKTAPIAKANKFFPSFIKDLPKTGGKLNAELEEVKTMTSCVGFIKNYQHGFIIPAWSDIRLRVTPENDTSWQWRIASCQGTVQVHSQEQRGMYADENKYQHFKLCPPWIIQASESLDVLWTNSHWNYTDPFEFLTLAGVINYEQVSEGNINILIPKTEEEKILEFNVNDPLAHLVPITERPIKIVNHLVSVDEYEQRRRSNMLDVKFKHRTKVEAQSKCPFSGK